VDDGLRLLNGGIINDPLLAKEKCHQPQLQKGGQNQGNFLLCIKKALQ